LRRIRGIGCLGLFVCLFALFASSASASSGQFQIALAPTTIKATPSKLLVRLPSAGNFQTFSNCSATLTGSAQAKTVSSLTGKLNGMTCTVLGNIEMSWNPTECDLEFTGGGGLNIVNCGTKPMEFSTTGCRITIGNQSTIGSIAYVNNASKSEVTAQPAVVGLTYTVYGCGATNGTGVTFSDGAIPSGSWTLSAYSGAPQTSIYWEEFYVPPTKFATQTAPATLAGGIGGSGKAKVARFPGNGYLSCHVTWSGSMSTRTSTALKVAPTFHECSFTMSDATVYEVPDSYISAGGCSYEFLFSSGFGLVGESCASKPVSVTLPNCIFSVGPQSGSGVMNYSTTGTGAQRKVAATRVEKQWLTYTVTGTGCLTTGTFSNGEIYGGTLEAKTSSGGEDGLFLE
jgi:hypothetical protein